MGSVPAWARVYVACVVLGALACRAPLPGTPVPWWAVALLAALYAACEQITRCPFMGHRAPQDMGAFFPVLLAGPFCCRCPPPRSSPCRGPWSPGSSSGREGCGGAGGRDGWCSWWRARRTPTRRSAAGTRSPAPTSLTRCCPPGPRRWCSAGCSRCSTADPGARRAGARAGRLARAPVAVAGARHRARRRAARAAADVRVLLGVRAVPPGAGGPPGDHPRAGPGRRHQDGYTRGHSERVGQASLLIARELGMDDERAEALRFAGTCTTMSAARGDEEVLNHHFGGEGAPHADTTPGVPDRTVTVARTAQGAAGPQTDHHTIEPNAFAHAPRRAVGNPYGRSAGRSPSSPGSSRSPSTP